MEGVIQITFKPNPPVDPMAIIGLIQKNKHIKLAGNDKIRIERELPDPKARAQMVRDLLRSLGQPVAAGVQQSPCLLSAWTSHLV
jgi:transcription-repair coupling factor (superfamily II helicase)